MPRRRQRALAPHPRARAARAHSAPPDLLPPIVAKIAGLAGSAFVLLEGIGVFTALGKEKIEKLLGWIMAPLVGPLGFTSVGYFNVTLGWLFSGLFFLPIPSVVGLVFCGAWLALVKGMDRLNHSAEAVGKAAGAAAAGPPGWGVAHGKP